MIHRLYNPWHITNAGERAADRHFTLKPGREGEPFYIIHQLRISSRFHRQMAGECDFVILTSAGIMVVEVKGGLIGHGRRDDGSVGFYRLTGLEGSEAKEPVKDPFLQAEENADAIRKYLAAKGFSDVFVGRMACFPECVFNMSDIGTQWCWSMNTGSNLPETVLGALEEQLALFEEKYGSKNMVLPVRWRRLKEAEILVIAEALKPEFEPRLYRTRALQNRKEAERRAVEGVHILAGLDGNRRIMVQGPPGSGKTTYALEIMHRLCMDEGRTGLYLCWNELLAAGMRNRLAGLDPPVNDDAVHVAPFFHFAGELAEMLGDASLKPTFEKAESSAMRQLMKECLAKLHAKKRLPRYDFIVADEAQDLFAKGLDQVIKSVLKDNNPLQKGSYYIFYDDRQAYPGTAEMEEYIRTRDALLEASAAYTLFSSLRSCTGHGIEQLIRGAEAGEADPRKEYGHDVKFTPYKTPEEAMALIRQRVDQELALDTASKNNIMVLLASDLFKAGSELKAALAANPEFELMVPVNYEQPSNKIRFTSILKSKGLEWDAMILVFSSLSDAKSQYQLFVGASRGKGKVYIVFKNE